MQGVIIFARAGIESRPAGATRWPDRTQRPVKSPAHRERPKMRLLPVVLAGGSGSRLWPLSRQACPTPFLKLGGSTLLQQAIERGQAANGCRTFHRRNQGQPVPCRGRAAAVRPAAGHHAPARARESGHRAGHRAGGAAVRPAIRRRYRDAGPAGRSSGAGRRGLRGQRGGCGASPAAQGGLVAWGISPTGPETGFGLHRGRPASGRKPARPFASSGGPTPARPSNTSPAAAISGTAACSAAPPMRWSARSNGRHRRCWPRARQVIDASPDVGQQASCATARRSAAAGPGVRPCRPAAGDNVLRDAGQVRLERCRYLALAGPRTGRG